MRAVVSSHFQRWPLSAGLTAALAMPLLLGGMMAFPAGYMTQTNTIIGLGILPFAFAIRGKTRINYLYISAMVMFGAAGFWWNVKIFYFFSLAFYLLVMTEYWIGRVSSLILFLLVFMSPFFHQVSVIMGFPLRLQLSSAAGAILSAAGFAVGVEGNTMVLNGEAFAVDDACLGLNMLALSMLAGVFLLARLYTVSGKKLSFLPLGIFFAVVFALNAISNLLRIILLVVFHFLPGNPLHDVTGLLCFTAYVLLPMQVIAKYLIKRSTCIHLPEHPPMAPGRHQISIAAVISCVLLFIGWHISTVQPSAVPHADVRLAGFKTSELDGGISKLVRDDLLVYVKPIAEFFSGEHTPLICWRGSGYKFQRIQVRIIGGREVYTATLVRGQERLYTAWWYSNGKIQTVRQLEWRTAMLRGADKFCLVNVTARDETVLQARVAYLLNSKFLNPANHETQHASR